MSKKIALDFGHGGHDNGASGNGLREKDVTLEVGNKVAKRLKDHGFEVVTLRSTDKFVGDAGQRGVELGKTKADYALSIHVNSASATSATGAEIIVPCKESYGVIEAYMMQELKAIGGFRKIYSREYNGATHNRVLNSSNKFVSTINKTDYYGINREAWKMGVSADIVELFFISNASDVKNYNAKKDAYVEALVKAICKGFGVEYKKPAVVTNPTPSKFAIGTYGGKVKTTDSLNVRAGRGVEHKHIATLAKGATVTINYIHRDNVDGTGNDTLWGSLDIKIDGKWHTGYVSMAYCQAV